jgi:uncharacterized protein (TIGR03000 family)
MKTVCVRAALCAALALCGAPISAAELTRREVPEVSLRSSTFRVRPPTPEARLYFEGSPVEGTGRERTFRTPALDAGRHFAYTVVAVWVENGREVTHEMHVKFFAGDDVVLDFRR